MQRPKYFKWWGQRALISRLRHSGPSMAGCGWLRRLLQEEIAPFMRCDAVPVMTAPNLAAWTGRIFLRLKFKTIFQSNKFSGLRDSRLLQLMRGFLITRNLFSRRPWALQMWAPATFMTNASKSHSEQKHCLLLGVWRYAAAEVLRTMLT